MPNTETISTIIFGILVILTFFAMWYYRDVGTKK